MFDGHDRSRGPTLLSRCWPIISLQRDPLHGTLRSGARTSFARLPASFQRFSANQSSAFSFFGQRLKTAQKSTRPRIRFHWCRFYTIWSPRETV